VNQVDSVATSINGLQDADVGGVHSPAAEFVDVDAHPPRWFWPLVAVGMAVMVAVIVGIGIKSRLPAVLPILFAICLAIFLIVNRLTLPDRLAARIAPMARDGFPEVLRVLFSSQWRYPGQNIQAVMTTLYGQGRRNVVARVNRAKKKIQINPLTEVFEPIPVDESAALFVALEREDAQEVVRDALGATDLDQRDATRKIKRNLALAGGLGIVLLFGFNAIMAGIESWQSKRIRPNLVIWSLWLVIAIFGLGGRGAYSWRQQWMLVPGGIVSRRSKMFRSATELHLFKRTESVLIAQSAHQKIWAVHVADAGGSQMARMTAREAHLLLRAWLNPIPPPPIERLSDLQ